MGTPDHSTTPLTGRVALVTGGSRGIGAAVAVDLARAGADVAVTYVANKERADAVVARIEALGRRGVAIAADSAHADAVVTAVDTAATTLGRLDILVNNAGVFPYGAPDDVTVEQLDHTLAVHVRAVFLAGQAALRHLGDGGRIVSIGSNLADGANGPGFALYTMSKSALSGFTRALAHDVGRRGITVNLVQPGSIDTEMNPAGTEHAAAQRTRLAVGHFGTPDDVAGLVTFLAGPQGRQITGTTLTVDGGYSA